MHLDHWHPEWLLILTQCYVDIVGLIFTTFITVFYLFPLYLVPIFVFYSSSAFCSFEKFMIPFSIPSLYISYTSFPTFFSGCTRVYDVQLTDIQFQITLYPFMVMWVPFIVASQSLDILFFLLLLFVCSFFFQCLFSLLFSLKDSVEMSFSSEVLFSAVFSLLVSPSKALFILVTVYFICSTCFWFIL